MENRMGWMKMLLVMAAVTAMASPSWSEASGKKPKIGKAEGILVSVIDTGVTVRTKKGALVSVTVNASTKIELNNVEVPLSSLTVGNNAELKFHPDTMIAIKIESTH